MGRTDEVSTPWQVIKCCVLFGMGIQLGWLLYEKLGIYQQPVITFKAAITIGFISGFVAISLSYHLGHMSLHRELKAAIFGLIVGVVIKHSALVWFGVSIPLQLAGTGAVFVAFIFCMALFL